MCLFHNTAAATAILLQHKDKLIFVRRGHEPSKGMLDLPGGFVDYNESAEEGILREIKEETGFKVEELAYFGSLPNRYIYKNVTYHTCDLLYTGKINDISTYSPSEEIPELLQLHPSEVNLNEIAFVSIREFVSRYLQKSIKKEIKNSCLFSLLRDNRFLFKYWSIFSLLQFLYHLVNPI